MATILCTKQVSKKQKERFRSDCFDVVYKKFIITKKKPFEFKNKTDLLLFTSKNAVKSVLKSDYYSKIKNIKCCCVGVKTKTLLEKNAFEVVAFANYAEDLAFTIKEKFSQMSFTFFSGNLRKDTLPLFFATNNIAYTEIETYTTVLKPSEIKHTYDAVVFFSPSAVTSFLKHNTLENKICFCIGTTTAKAIANNPNITGIKKIITANQPTIESTIKKIKQYYK